MKNVFLDANILIDLIKRRDGYEQSMEILRNENLELYISSLSVHVVTYVLKIKPNSSQMRDLIDFLSDISIIPLSNTQVSKALELGYKDFEDMLQFFSAVEFCDTILTRNRKDFEKIKKLTKSKINIISPK